MDHDPEPELRAVTVVTEGPMALLVPPGSPYRTMQGIPANPQSEAQRHYLAEVARWGSLLRTGAEAPR